MTSFSSADRRFFDKVTRDGQVPFTGSRDGPRFLQAVLGFGDKQELLYRLTNAKEQGLSRLKLALANAATLDGINKYIVPLLAVFGSDALTAYACRQPLLQVLEECYRVPGLMRCLHDALVSGRVQEPVPVGWFALTLASKVDDVRQDPLVQAMATYLEGCGGAAAKTGNQLLVVLGGGHEAAGGMAAGAPNQMIALEDLQSGPGGRHDNDHQNYRRCAPARRSCLAWVTRQFRLMREDMVQPLRQSLRALGFAAPQASEGKNAEQAGQAPQAAAARPPNVPQMLQRNIFPLVAVLGVALKPRPCIMVAVELPKSHKAARMKNHRERLEYWTDYGFGTLAQDALMCLAYTPPGSQQKCVVFGTIARRDAKELAGETPVVGLSLERGADAEQLMQLVGCGRLNNAMLVQVSTSFFSYEPLLKALQSMTTVPLAEEIVRTQEPSDAGYMTPVQIEQAVAARTTLDPTQQQAMRQALKSRVGLIQGPPGTGKTFVGALVADTIVQHSSERILVVCYTNHALDQFLEAILDMGITSIIRIGSKSKSTKLEQYNLFQRSKSSSSRLGNIEGRRLWGMREQEDECKQEIARLEQLLVFISSNGFNCSNYCSWNAADERDKRRQQQQQQGSQQQQLTAQQQHERQQQGRVEVPEAISVNHDGTQYDLWRVLGPYLHEEHSDTWHQLQPRESKGSGGGLSASGMWRQWLSVAVRAAQAGA